MISCLRPGLGAAMAPWLAHPTQTPLVQLSAQADPEGEATPGEASSEGKPEEAEADGLKPFDQTIKDLVPQGGLFTLYQDPQANKALLGIQPAQLNQNLLLIATLESGIGEAGLFRGWPINDLVIQLRQAPDNKLQVVVPNIYFRNPQNRPPNRPQDPQLLQESFSDSILFALPILSIHPDSGEMLIDLGDFLLSRDPADISGAFPFALGSYSVNSDTSYLGELKAFPGNVEMEAVLGFSGGGGDSLFSLFSARLDSVPDSRGFSLRVRYSLSSLPSHPGFKPRLADERIGYFISAYRTPVSPTGGDPFVRYINRWPLEKQDPTAALSPPRQPIVFWIENAVPQEYRAAIREGVEWWNEAFERAGFSQAIEVRQMPPDADWDPADVRYNVIRWSDSYAPWALGLGPSRVNPLTGEILDADVVLDASVIGYLTQQYQTFSASLGAETATALLQLCGHPLEDRLLARLTRSDGAVTQPVWAG
ncbi:MAG: DUF5117 domain-containing protein [Leptolyngbyaceae cyanobacterium SM2_3_12]|nr:DUF5117 domain-containing protein [Leptolyngbyaceae cyanobacterium SM2_3_12]